jgi:hypothetical protein
MLTRFNPSPPPRFRSTLTEREKASETYRTPMPGSRLMGNLQYTRSENNTRHAIQQIVWDTPSESFIHRFDSYDAADENKIAYTVRVEKPLPHATVLPSDFVPGTLVDQVQKRLVLPDGRWNDGPTGDIYSVHDIVVMHRDPDKAKKAAAAEKSM